MRVTRSQCRLALTLLVSLSVLCGCVREYYMTLDNGDQILSLSKPKPQGDRYVFTGNDGVGRTIPKNRVLKVQSVSSPRQDNGTPAPAESKGARHWYFLWLA